MQAEHIPVHLGSMPDAVAAVLDERARARRSNGSSTTPTAAAPTCPTSPSSPPSSSPASCFGFAASRAHHADVGGPTPGSMPAFSRTPRGGGRRDPADPGRRRRRSRGSPPRCATRDQRLADLRAQQAANRIGAAAAAPSSPSATAPSGCAPGWRRSSPTPSAAPAPRCAALPDGSYAAEDVLEDDSATAASATSRLRVAATIDGERLTLDFAGTDPQVDGNLNCPLSVTKSAAFFAVRVLTDPDAPPCAGAHRPIEVVRARRLPAQRRATRPPSPPATSRPRAGSPTSCIAALGGARPVPAQGQGTMNNLTLAGDDFTYYETLGGGQGACPDADGPSAIHVAMSNTLNTPVEALETEFPLRVRELVAPRGQRRRRRPPRRRRASSARSKRWRRCASRLITERRRHPPPRTRRRRRRRTGSKPASTALPLPSPRVEGDLAPESRLRIETPGGGGHRPA